MNKLTLAAQRKSKAVQHPKAYIKVEMNGIGCAFILLGGALIVIAFGIILLTI